MEPNQNEQAAETPERLLSAREAALLLEATPRTAQLRARRALTSGDRAVQTIAGAYCAPAWWLVLPCGRACPTSSAVSFAYYAP